MQIEEWSEEGFIQHLLTQFAAEGNVVGIGDDCAVIPAEGGRAWLVTTDALVEGVHFLKEQISPSDAGFKTVAVNVSDIAAMGGEPKYAFLTVAIPKHLDADWVREMVQGVKSACQQWNIQLLGGDTVGSKRDIFLNLTLMGSALQSHIKYRHGAKPGDLICVTGYLGDSGGGLKALQNHVTHVPQKLIEAHFHPQPRPEEGMWLASHDDVHSMMDVSDGLNCDLRRLLAASHCGGMIEVTHLPISQELSGLCAEQGWDAVELSLTGGEDYCLLFTMDPKAFESVQESFYQKFGKPLYPIGEVTAQTDQLTYQKKGHDIKMRLTDFQHWA